MELISSICVPKIYRKKCRKRSKRYIIDNVFYLFCRFRKDILWSQAIRSIWSQVDQICIYMVDLILIYNVHDVTIIANYNLTDRQIKINTCNQIDKIKKPIITFYILPRYIKKIIFECKVVVVDVYNIPVYIHVLFS